MANNGTAFGVAAQAGSEAGADLGILGQGTNGVLEGAERDDLTGRTKGGIPGHRDGETQCCEAARLNEPSARSAGARSHQFSIGRDPG